MQVEQADHGVTLGLRDRHGRYAALVLDAKTVQELIVALIVARRAQWPQGWSD